MKISAYDPDGTILAQTQDEDGHLLAGATVDGRDFVLRAAADGPDGRESREFSVAGGGSAARTVTVGVPAAGPEPGLPGLLASAHAGLAIVWSLEEHERLHRCDDADLCQAYRDRG